MLQIKQYIYLQITMSLNTYNPQTSNFESQLIRQLKEKLHKSFIELSDIQKIYQGQLDTQKEVYQARIIELQTQNLFLRNKIDEFELKEKQKLSKQFLTMGESFIFPTLKKQYTSFIHDQSFSQFIKEDESPVRKNNLNLKYLQLKYLQQQIKNQIYEIPEKLSQYFKFTKEIQQKLESVQFENMRLDEQIKQLKAKCKQFNSEREQLLKNRQNLKEDNEKLADMYKEQLQKTQRLQGMNKFMNSQRILSPKFRKIEQNLFNSIENKQINYRQVPKQKVNFWSKLKNSPRINANIVAQ